MSKIKTLVISVITLVLLATVFTVYTVDKNRKTSHEALSKVNDSYTIEYGANFDIEDLEIDYDNAQLNFREGFDYPEVGEYEIEVHFDYLNKSWSKKVQLKIEDTLPPIIISYTDKYSLIVGTNFKADPIEVQDLSDVTVSIDESDLDINKVGSYILTATATDASDNSASVTFEVIIKDKPVAKPTTPPTNNTANKPSSKYPHALKATYRNGHVIVNKKYGLPENFATGENPEAAGKVKQLIAQMKQLGLRVDSSYAGYRTFDHQKYLYENAIKNHGQAYADKSSAVPGHSEHQTGLTFDLRAPSGALLTSEPEIAWVRENAHKYGFVVRYPEGKTHITGYKYEPWHLRYMGSDAEPIYQSGKTLEEYFNIDG